TTTLVQPERLFFLHTYMMFFFFATPIQAPQNLQIYLPKHVMKSEKEKRRSQESKDFNGQFIFQTELTGCNMLMLSKKIASYLLGKIIF
ncbi:MAG: hypothetical protein LBI60_00775, partial [Bacteroidales bacterium]|nr:hypothetical protein [Bacteroidales bacterium]